MHAYIYIYTLQAGSGVQGDAFWRTSLTKDTAMITVVTAMPRSGDLIVGWSTGHVQVYDLKTGMFRTDLEIQKSLFKPETKVHEACAVTCLQTFRPVEARFVLRDVDRTRDALSQVRAPTLSNCMRVNKNDAQAYPSWFYLSLSLTRIRRRRTGVNSSRTP